MRDAVSVWRYVSTVCWYDWILVFGDHAGSAFATSICGSLDQRVRRESRCGSCDSKAGDSGAPGRLVSVSS